MTSCYYVLLIANMEQSDPCLPLSTEKLHRGKELDENKFPFCNMHIEISDKKD